jgi:hypothetical protein
MATTMPLSGFRLTQELRDRIDLVASPFSDKRTKEWREAHDIIKAVMKNPRQWEVVYPKPGHRHSHVTRNLGEKRIEWLKEFCREELGYDPDSL